MYRAKCRVCTDTPVIYLRYGELVAHKAFRIIKNEVFILNISRCHSAGIDLTFCIRLGKGYKRAKRENKGDKQG